jgi:hypothetical protein
MPSIGRVKYPFNDTVLAIEALSSLGQPIAEILQNGKGLHVILPMCLAKVGSITLELDIGHSFKHNDLPIVFLRVRDGLDYGNCRLLRGELAYEKQ